MKKAATEVMRSFDLIQPVGIAMALAVVHSIHAGPPADYRGKPFDDAAYRTGQRAEAERPALPFRAFTQGLIVWNGTNSTHDAGWVRGGEPGTSVSLESPDADGKRAIHFRAAVPGYRRAGFGWDWATPQENGVDVRQYGAVSFSLKVTGTKMMQELFFGLNRDSTAPVSIRPYQPSFLDGAWHRVTIPLHAFHWSPEGVSKVARGFTLETFVWGAADFDVFVGDVRFDRETAPPSDTAPSPTAGGETTARGQAIPGRLECAFYDLGGEGVAYHDTTPINILSAVLNQQAIHQRPHATPDHWNYRREEGVDVSYVKDFADLNHPNNPDPPVNQLYIGGTEDGEWCNYTVQVKSAGVCKIIATYANTAGMKPLRFSVDGKPAAECACPIVTGSMHTWTRQDIGRITFPEAGVHLLTLHYERGYNLGHFDLEAAK